MDGGFMNLPLLQSISLPNIIKTIGKYAFSRCFNLTEFTVPASTTRLGEYCFEGCTALIK